MLQTWTSDGRQTLRLGDRIFKFAGVAQVGWDFTGATKSGRILVPEFSRYVGAEPLAFAIKGAFNPGGGPLKLTTGSFGVDWEFSDAAATQTTRLNTTFVYGFF